MSDTTVIPETTEKTTQGIFEKSLEWVLKRMTGKRVFIGLLVCLFGTIFFYFLFKYLLYRIEHHEAAFFDSVNFAINQGVEHIDLGGYLIGIFAIAVGLLVATLIDQLTQQKLTELEKANIDIKVATREIMGATKELQEASSLRVLGNFADISDKLAEMLRSDSKDPIRKFYMKNGPSSFGKIHAYNRRLLRDFATEFDKNSPEIDNQNLKTFREKVREIERLIVQCSDLKEFKMHVNSEKALNTFILDYFNTENTDIDIISGNGLMFYKIEDDIIKIKNEVEVSKESIKNGKLNAAESEKKELIQKKIEETFKKFNKNVIDKCRLGAKDIKNILEDDEENDETTSIQLYLVETKRIKKSLTVFYFNDKNEATTSRILVGTYSENPHIFNALEKIYLKDFSDAYADKKKEEEAKLQQLQQSPQQQQQQQPQHQK